MTSFTFSPPAAEDQFPPPEKPPNITRQDYKVDVAFANAGNRPALVIDVGLLPLSSNPREIVPTGKYDMFSDNSYHDPGVAADLPFTLPAHEIRLLHLTIHSETFVQFKDFAAKKGGNSLVFKIGIGVKAVDSSGAGYDMTTDTGLRVRLTDGDNVLHPAPSEDRGMISIFKKVNGGP